MRAGWRTGTWSCWPPVARGSAGRSPHYGTGRTDGAHGGVRGQPPRGRRRRAIRVGQHTRCVGQPRKVGATHRRPALGGPLRRRPRRPPAPPPPARLPPAGPFSRGEGGRGSDKRPRPAGGAPPAPRVRGGGALVGGRLEIRG